ncbi:MAG: hypothetical protein R2771_10295 [Saprospiraceae bacterium]
MFRLFILMLIIVLFPKVFFGQTYKMGKVDKELLKLDKCDFENDAKAMITVLEGSYKTKFVKTVGYVQNFEINKQIKVFNYDESDTLSYDFYFYSPKENKKSARVITMKGNIYNLQKGKVVKSKLSKKDFIVDQFTDLIKKVTITCPNAKSSSVIEYSINTESYFFNFYDWYIQDKYPIVQNDFKISYPDFFDLDINISGDIAPKSDIESNSSQTQMHGAWSYTLDLDDREIKFINIPSIDSEPFSSNVFEKAPKIEFRLKSILWPDGKYENVMVDKMTFTKDLLQSRYFGEILNQPIKDLKYDITGLNSFEKAEFIYSKFQRDFLWNQKPGYTTDIDYQQLKKRTEADVAAINLNYIACLNANGVNTFPLLLNTSGINSLTTDYFLNTDFNYVLAASIIGNDTIFSDPTSNFPFGILPYWTLQDKTWLVKKYNPKWINLQNRFTDERNTNTFISIENNILKYSIEEVYNAYFDDEVKNNFSSKNGKYLNPDSSKIEITLNNNIKVKKSFSSKFDSDTLIFVPFINPAYITNPFINENRVTNIDFRTLQSFSNVSTLVINKSYDFKMPENINLLELDNNLIFQYKTIIAEEKNTATITTKLKINKTVFDVEDYQYIRAFFDTVVAKYNEPIIAVKK